jgi:hypothetical protein
LAAANTTLSSELSCRQKHPGGLAADLPLNSDEFLDALERLSAASSQQTD